MIKRTIQDAINGQIAKEMYSANLYLQMAAYFHSINLNGFANWMRVQVQEETFHSMKFFDYIIDRGGEAIISELKAPPTKWDFPLAAFEAAMAHEQFITNSINELADLALKESDHATNNMLLWFINEQVEEEANVSDIVGRLKLIGDFNPALLTLDTEMKQRVFVPPATAAGA